MKTRISGNQIEVHAPAKLNLFLEILCRRGDGFHELDTVMTAVGIYDQLRFVRRKDAELNLHLTQSRSKHDRSSPIPTDEKNLIIQALDCLREHTSTKCFGPLGCDVYLKKQIPSEAGLGGASSDAAAALIAGNRLWDLNLKTPQLHEMATRLGSDVPYFLYGGTAVCRGRGERIKPVACPAGLPVVIAKPQSGLATSAVFEKTDIPDSPLDSKNCLSALREGQPLKIAETLFNRLQTAAQSMVLEIAKLSDAFSKLGCLGHQMSGSGTCYFGIFPTAIAAKRAAKVLQNRVPDTTIFSTHTLGPQADMLAWEG